MVICALTPFLVLSSAIPPLEGMIGSNVGLGSAGLEMSAGMADAAYCLGTVLAVQLVTRLPGRRLLVLYALIFTLASVLTAAASNPEMFFAGRILQGLMTSLMLITAAPTLALGWPVPRLRSTAVVMNLGIFGAVALGPLIGGAFAGLESWRTLFWIATGVGATAFALVLLTYKDQAPADPDVKFDPISIGLASSGCVAAFFGASNLVNHSFTNPIVLVPMIGGLLLIVALIVHQASVRDPLMPVKQLGHTVPVAAIALAMFAGAGSVSLVGLLQLTIATRELSSALFWPEFIGALITATVFGFVFFTRYVPVFAFAGMLVLACTGVLVTGAADGSTALIAAGTLGIGIGVGASVAPGLFVAGFSLPAMQLPRIFALVELLRGVAAFLTAPIIIHLAVNSSGSFAHGITTATWVATGILLTGVVAIIAIIVSGGVRLQTPTIAAWLEGEGSAIHSPSLGAALRRRRRRKLAPEGAD
jgi:MFS family permease